MEPEQCTNGDIFLVPRCSNRIAMVDYLGNMLKPLDDLSHELRFRAINVIRQIVVRVQLMEYLSIYFFCPCFEPVGPLDNSKC